MQARMGNSLLKGKDKALKIPWTSFVNSHFMNFMQQGRIFLIISMPLKFMHQPASAGDSIKVIRLTTNSLIDVEHEKRFKMNIFSMQINIKYSNKKD